MSLRLLILGAHPDDAEYHAGGLAAIYRSLGHTVKMVSLTNGDAGHHEMRGPELAARRRREAAAAGAVIGAEYVTWEHHDGLLEPTLELRFEVIRELRRFRPDLVLTHRPNDYHPDHRAVGDVVRDASYMVTVPAIVPDEPILPRDPVVAYLPDRFTKPCPLQPDVVIDVTDRVETIVDMLACHKSQFFEWLPFNRGVLDQVPPAAAERREWLRAWYLDHLRAMTDRWRPQLIATYGEARGRQIELAEAYEISEYAGGWDEATKGRLFPFVPG
jgi:LmbE family N-acetylglucosaminyl deacetylase